MKRHLNNILFFIPIIALVFFVSCASNMEREYEDESVMFEAVAEEATEDENMELFHGFEELELDKNSLEVFEKRALQKISDLSDYLKMLSDSTMDSALQDHLRKMIMTMFESDKNMIRYTNPVSNESIHIRIGEFLESIISKEIDPPEVLNNQSINTYLQKVSSSYYKGDIHFDAKYTISNIPNMGYKKFNIQIILTMVEKDFGDNTRTVWEIFLGDIEEI